MCIRDRQRRCRGPCAALAEGSLGVAQARADGERRQLDCESILAALQARDLPRHLRNEGDSLAES
eukprot:4972001-Alexandrium_andersonii.AAC.1